MHKYSLYTESVECYVNYSNNFYKFISMGYHDSSNKHKINSAVPKYSYKSGNKVNNRADIK